MRFFCDVSSLRFPLNLGVLVAVVVVVKLLPKYSSCALLLVNIVIVFVEAPSTYERGVSDVPIGRI